MLVEREESLEQEFFEAVSGDNLPQVQELLL
jgi:hypothetical protein